MHAVIGRVMIKPGREDETLAMIRERGVAMLGGHVPVRRVGIGRGQLRASSSNTPFGYSILRVMLERQRRPSTPFAKCPMRRRRS